MKMQLGATLIIILVMLLLITILGTVAVKTSVLGLNIATNSQIQALLLENSDAALFNIEDQSKVAGQMNQDGMFGYFNATDITDELVFCYRAAESVFFSMDKASVIEENNAFTKNGISGFCTRNSFASGRSAILSQIYLSKNTQASTPLTSLAQGTSAGSSELPVVSNNISVMVISVLPSFADASSNQINTCFKKTAIKKTNTTETVEECFAALDIPYNVQYADYQVGASPKVS